MSFQFVCYQTIFRIRRIVLFLDSAHPLSPGASISMSAASGVEEICSCACCGAVGGGAEAGVAEAVTGLASGVVKAVDSAARISLACADQSLVMASHAS